MVRLQRPHASYWRVYAISLGVWFSGTVWLVSHYFFMRQTDFGPAPSPLEHTALMIHGALAFAALWLMGFLWGNHVVKRWRHHRHRKTGGTLFAVMLVLIVTGYFLYYPAAEEWRIQTGVVHWVIGLVMPLVLLAHWLIRAR